MIFWSTAQPCLVLLTFTRELAALPDGKLVLCAQVVISLKKETKQRDKIVPDIFPPEQKHLAVHQLCLFAVKH